MQPIDPSKSPKVHIPALNHVGLWVDSLPNAVKYLTDNGIRFTPGGIRKGAGGIHCLDRHDLFFFLTSALSFTAGHDVAFIHPKSAVGVLVELIQAPETLLKGQS